MSSAFPAQAQKPMTGYAPVNGLKMYYEIHGSGGGEPLVLLHGSFMTISNNWTGWIGELSKARTVIAVEMQGHGRTADIDRDFSYESLADDIAAILDYLEIERADLLGYSMGGGVAMQVAIRHPERVRKRSESRLAVLLNTTHVTLMEKGNAIIPLVNEFLDAKKREEAI